MCNPLALAWLVGYLFLIKIHNLQQTTVVHLPSNFDMAVHIHIFLQNRCIVYTPTISYLKLPRNGSTMGPGGLGNPHLVFQGKRLSGKSLAHSPGKRPYSPSRNVSSFPRAGRPLIGGETARNPTFWICASCRLASLPKGRAHFGMWDTVRDAAGQLHFHTRLPNAPPKSPPLLSLISVGNYYIDHCGTGEGETVKFEQKWSSYIRVTTLIAASSGHLCILTWRWTLLSENLGSLGTPCSFGKIPTDQIDTVDQVTPSP